ncbi:MAG TPA: flippase-like domain-containing protein [Dyella sp.]|uniref:flippase-like domain-containing protein n=1 Tax=Dyella sp. TaxID=1869338 RepID=UPI002BED95CE|nr:flippase-like domain-containing protein [Dyella sp.]HTV84891.1 flippase-like domain-containing protein [Dyella sp.]
MKRLSYIAGLLGLAAAIALIAHQGWGEIAKAIDHAGWGLLWLLPFHALPLLFDVLGWRALLAPRDPHGKANLPFLFWVAAVREGSNRLLPVANIGGEIIGIRLVKWRGIDGAAAAASVIMEVLLTLVNQYLFTALGILLLIELTQSVGTFNSVIGALIASLPLPIFLIIILRHGKVFSRLESFAEKLLGGRSKLTELIDGSRLDLEIRSQYSRPLRLVVSCGWQLLGFVVGSFETWFALHLLGYPIGVGDAIAIEAVTQALRHIIFVVPAGLGVQEGGLVLFGNMVGLPPEASVALSVIKRMREVGFGVPALLSWQWAETRRLYAAASTRTAQSSVSRESES